MARHRRRDEHEEDLPPTPITGRTLREAAALARYLLPYRVKFIAALLALLAGSAAGLAFPYFAGSLVDSALVHLGGSHSRPVAPARGPAWQHNANTVALALVAVLAVQATFAFLRAVWFIEVGERSLADLRRDTFARLVRLPMAFHTQRRVGELASRISADLTQIRDTLTDTFPQLLRQATLLVGAVALVTFTSPLLTGLMLVSLPPLIMVAALFGRVIRRVSRQAQDRLADSNVIVEESLQNIASVKAFANEDYEEKRYRTALDRFVQMALRGAWYHGAFLSFILFALFGAIVLVLWYGVRLVLAGDLSAGDLARFMLYTFYVGGAVGSFAELYSQLQRTLGASSRVRELLQEQPEPVDVPTGGLPHRLRGEVAFEGVHFRYPSRPEVEVLRGVSLRARPGERVALVGPSGAGKSTLVSLLLRFFDPTEGRVLLDGRDAREYDLHSLRGQMAIVPQDVILFGGTIADNIAYGRPGATPEDIEASARQANAHDFIMSFPDGYQTRVGERGVQLSGGQRQRVAIARAILRDPAILILDEATSSLDSESERLVLQALEH
jgi:ATP-binding cassette subfamily B protein